jgi:hypothetical protein
VRGPGGGISNGAGGCGWGGCPGGLEGGLPKPGLQGSQPGLVDEAVRTPRTIGCGLALCRWFWDGAAANLQLDLPGQGSAFGDQAASVLRQLPGRLAKYRGAAEPVLMLFHWFSLAQRSQSARGEVGRSRRLLDGGVPVWVGWGIGTAPACWPARRRGGALFGGARRGGWVGSRRAEPICAGESWTAEVAARRWSSGAGGSGDRNCTGVLTGW